MVYYTGDIHGQRYEIERFCKRFKPTRDDTIVILGDVGANYSLDERDAELKEALDKLKPTILCIHGMMDYRIPYDQGMAAFNTAQMMGVPSKLIVFPEENHWILQPQNALFWHRSYFDWLDRWCK